MKPEFIVKRDNKDFVLYAGLLDLAHERGLKEIHTNLVQVPSELNGMTAIVWAKVTTEAGEYSGIGDAAPTNVTRMMAPHIIRMAETRAKARALRDAVNIGMVALEELGDASADEDASQTHQNAALRPAAARAVPAPIAAPKTSPAPDLERLKQTYSTRVREAIALGVAWEKLPHDADLNTTIDMGVALKDRLDEKRREIDAQRQGAGQ